MKLLGHCTFNNTFSAPLLGVIISKGSLQRSVGVITRSQSFEDGRLTIRHGSSDRGSGNLRRSPRKHPSSTRLASSQPSTRTTTSRLNSGLSARKVMEGRLGQLDLTNPVASISVRRYKRGRFQSTTRTVVQERENPSMVSSELEFSSDKSDDVMLSVDQQGPEIQSNCSPGVQRWKSS